MLEKVMEMLSVKQKAKLVESATPKELRKMFPQLEGVSKGELTLIGLAICRIVSGEKRRKRQPKNTDKGEESPTFSTSEHPEKPKRTRRYKRNAEGVLERQESSEA